MKLSTFTTYVKEGFSLDKHSLALARIVIGLTILSDVFNRAKTLVLDYTSDGIFPKDIWISQFSNPSNFTFHYWVDEIWWVQFLFILQGLIAVAFTLGYKTRWTTFALWLFYLSLNNRNWYINDSGDDSVRIFLMLFFFLPMGARYGIDAFLTRKRIAENSVYSWVNFIAFMQIGIIYFVSSLLKSHPSWNASFSAIADAMELDLFVSPLGLLLKDFPSVTKFLTFSVYGLELLGPILFWLTPFLGYRGQWLRLLLVFVFISFHLGLVLFMHLGPFPFFMMGIWCAFLPSVFWETILPRLKTPNRLAFQIFYDEECGFCKKTVCILKGFFLIPEAKMAPAQSQPEINELMLKHNSWVVITADNQKKIKFEAIVTFFGQSPLIGDFSKLLNIPIFFKVGTKIYEWVASHRQLMGKLTKPFQWKEEEKETQWHHLDKVFVIFFALAILQLNLKGKILRKTYRYLKLYKYSRTIGLYQNWGMFSPYVQVKNSWFVFRGIFSDRAEFDLLSMGPVNYDKPETLLSLNYANKHQRKFLNNLENDGLLQERVSSFYCEKYRDMKTFKMYLISDKPKKLIEHRYNKVCR
ncbi:MAG: HTTM domain-containing protein [Bacteriovoracaceae bacterium]|nr:HTTM domain-containing protein [Bacteriovoracaceae bacterium]